MKKKILLFTLVAGLGSLVISSYITGAANNGYDCTGAETGDGNVAGCSNGRAGSCHSTTATTGITLAIELDSAGVATTQYKAGGSYTIKITGTNTTSNSLPKFGFQVGVITGSVSATTPTNAGAFVTGSLPANTHYSAASSGAYVLNIVEHSTQLSPASGTGATGTTYVESIPWTAPASGTGTISIWSALNAVDDNGTNDANDLWNTNHLVITEENTSGVANVTNNINVKTYPNPFINNLELQMDGALEGTYTLQVFDLSGRSLVNENISVSSNSYHTNIATGTWVPGMYNIVLAKDGYSKVIPVVKQ